MTTTNFPHALWPCVQYVYIYIFLETCSAKSAAAYLRSWSWRCLVMLTACIVLSLTTANACCTELSATSRESRASKFRNSAGLGGSAAFASCEFSQRTQHLIHLNNDQLCIKSQNVYQTLANSEQWSWKALTFTWNADWLAPWGGSKTTKIYQDPVN